MIVKDKIELSEIFSRICLMLGMFFLPFGFDVLFHLIMTLTGSFWTTDVIFYCLSGLFFGSSILLRKYSKSLKDK